mgnify:CR=1 FL=1
MALIELNCAELSGTVPVDNFKKVAEYVLTDPDYGFFIIAREDEQAVGLMYFSHEWSDWRNGLFFWLQTAYAKDNKEEVHKEMLKHLEAYSTEKGCVGYRLCSEKANSDYWAPIIGRMELSHSHYYIYHVDTV